MPTHLLDVNVLIALAWPNHVHHRAARDWFAEHSTEGWATTPVTELGFVRVSSNRNVLPDAVLPGTALEVLSALCQRAGHEFWADGSRLVDPPFALDPVGTHRQITDVHLAALALRHEGRLLTFDRGVVETMPPAYRETVELLTGQ